MLLDNENDDKKIHKWIKKKVKNGTFRIVTGYFSSSALSNLTKEINDKITKFQIVIGDYMIDDHFKSSSLDLINEDLSIEKALGKNADAKNVVEFLNQNKVELKTTDPNFCHAKAYIFENDANDKTENFYIMGSSNLTDAGLGIKFNNNIELNVFSNS